MRIATSATAATTPNRGTVQQRVEYRTNVDVHLGARVAAGLGYSESAKAA
jgi:hypothetical protein